MGDKPRNSVSQGERTVSIKLNRRKTHIDSQDRFLEEICLFRVLESLGEVDRSPSRKQGLRLYGNFKRTKEESKGEV